MPTGMPHASRPVTETSGHVGTRTVSISEPASV
jgi:hypothetical protein